VRSTRLLAALVALGAGGVLVGSAPARTLGSQISIASVKALPPPVQRAGGVLSAGKSNVVFSAGFVSLKLALRNAGSSAADRVRVTIVVSRGGHGSPLSTSETVGEIGPGETATVTFAHVGKVPFAVQSSLTLEVNGVTRRVYPLVFVSPD